MQQAVSTAVQDAEGAHRRAEAAEAARRLEAARATREEQRRIAAEEHLAQQRAAPSPSLARSVSAPTEPVGTDGAAEGTERAAAMQVASLEEALRGAREEVASLRAEMDAKEGEWGAVNDELRQIHAAADAQDALHSSRTPSLRA
ncbi:hypothetical protein T484DRAFT_1828447 [Baffinella frigidus]|nr:hypothetical protein T484DRAFT_1828447 [Cryptophyta sp. CCMP2293]